MSEIAMALNDLDDKGSQDILVRVYKRYVMLSNRGYSKVAIALNEQASLEQLDAAVRAGNRILITRELNYQAAR